MRTVTSKADMPYGPHFLTLWTGWVLGVQTENDASFKNGPMNNKRVDLLGLCLFLKTPMQYVPCPSRKTQTQFVQDHLTSNP
jgi:hypothetical protein